MSGSLAAVSYPNMISKYLQFSLSLIRLLSCSWLFCCSNQMHHPADRNAIRRVVVVGHSNNKVAQKIAQKKWKIYIKKKQNKHNSCWKMGVFIRAICTSTGFNKYGGSGFLLRNLVFFCTECCSIIFFLWYWLLYALSISYDFRQKINIWLGVAFLSLISI